MRGSRPPKPSKSPRPASSPQPEGPETAPSRPSAPLLACLPPIIPPASVSLLAGAPGAGKTTLVAWLATRFRDCLPIFGHQPNPVPRQLFISADRSWKDSTRLWFDAVGFPDIEAYSLQDDRAFKKIHLRKRQERMTVLRACLDRFAPIVPGTLAWVDPISLFLGGNLIDYDTCMVACCEIRELCQDHGLTVIGTAHAGKQKADKMQRYLRFQDRIAGSVALFGYTDTQMYLAEPSEVGEEYYLFGWHPHHSKPETFQMQRNASGLFEPYADPDAGRERELLSAIPLSPDLTRVRDILEAAYAQGISKRSCFRFLDTLTAQQAIVKVGRGQYTRPKTH